MAGTLTGTPAPSQQFLLDLHRGPDGYISYATKLDGEWQILGAAPVGQPWLPGLEPLLRVDAYASINSSFRTGYRVTSYRSRYVPAVVEGQHVEVLRETPKREKIDPTTGLLYSCYDQKSLRWLNACYVDLDCYAAGLDVEDTIAEILRRQERGEIPPATMFGRSGRGLWLFWFLIDELNPARGAKFVHQVMHLPDTPQRASVRATRRFAHIQGELVNRLRDLGADPLRKTAVSFTRVPGSLNSKSGHRVDYWAQGADGKGFYYRLPQLLDALSLADPGTDDEPVTIETADKDASHQVRGTRGWNARWQNLLRNMWSFIAMRGGGLDEGHRNAGAYYLAFAMHKLDSRDIEAEISKYAERCRPPLSAREQRDAITQAIKRPRFSWTRIKGESNVQGGGENGSVEGRGTGRGIGTDGGSPEGDWSPCRRRGGRGGLPGAGAAVERQPEARRGAAAAAWRIAGGAVP